MLNSIIGFFITKKEKEVYHPVICGKANKKTWLNPYLKLEFEEKMYSNPGHTTLLWSVAAWSGGKWMPVSRNHKYIEHAIYFMKEINGHSFPSDHDRLYWDINCGYK